MPTDESLEAARRLFRDGVSAFRAGEYPVAEAHFRRALELTPPRASVLTNLANALLAQGKAADALGFAERSVRLDESSADGWFVLARCLQSLGRDSEALAGADRAIACDPKHMAACALRFDILSRSGRHQEALAQANAALPLAPDSGLAWHMRGSALSALSRHEEALACYQQAVQLDPSHAPAWQNLGVTLCWLKRPGESLACFDTVIRLAPNRVDAWLNRGIARVSLGEADRAIADFDQGLARDPLNPELWFNRGVAFAAAGRTAEALVCYEKSLQIDPNYAEAWNNRGICLKALRPDQALACHDKAIECKPDYAEAWTNRGWLLYESTRYLEALASYESALRIDPDHAEAHWNEALARLLLGEFEIGWKKYAYRWKIHAAVPPRRTERPLTLLEDISPGSRVLLWGEQGYGDTIQFCRYALVLADRGAQVFVEAQPPLKVLLGSLGVRGVLAQGDPLPAFDFQAALLDLPALFRTSADSIPAPTKYLRADAELAAQWRARLPPRNGKPRIGISCSGSAAHPNDHNRSMPLALFAPLCERAQLFLIQKELRDGDATFLQGEPTIRFLGDRLDSFSDSAAIVADMDLVISVDTSLAHLAGALGKTVWILLPWAPEWRWMLARTDCPWYPTATLIRQDAPGDWDGVMQRVLAALER